MSDLPGGKFPQTNPLWSFLGQQTNQVNSSVPVRTNLERPLLAGLTDTAAGLGALGVQTAVLIPIDPGTVVTTVSVVIGASIASTPTHQITALYSGTKVAAPPLIVQSTDTTTTAQTANTRLDSTLTTPTLITPAMAPYGYIWAGVTQAGTTAASAYTTASVVAAAGQFAWFTNMAGGNASAAGGFCVTAGSSIGATAPATLIFATARTVEPVVFLW